MVSITFIRIFGYVVAFALGCIIGRWFGYLDAQPKRDKSGKFISKD